jgi:hypothetical protein
MELKKETTPIEDGIRSETWRNEDGQLHRIDGPAWFQYRADGTLWTVGWWIDGSFHREDGPAYTELDRKGNVIEESWYIHGRKQKESEVLVMKRKLVIDAVIKKETN